MSESPWTDLEPEPGDFLSLSFGKLERTVDEVSRGSRVAYRRPGTTGPPGADGTVPMGLEMSRGREVVPAAPGVSLPRPGPAAQAIIRCGRDRESAVQFAITLPSATLRDMSAAE